MPATEHQIEKLNAALQGYLRADAAVRTSAADKLADNVFAHIRAMNVLADACIDCGMSPSEPSADEWAATRVARWLMEA